MKRKRHERQAAKLAWEAIQRVELCTSKEAAYEIVDQTARALGCDFVQLTCERDDASLPVLSGNLAAGSVRGGTVSGPSAIFRLSSGQGRWLTVSLGLPVDSSPAADIVFRYLQRLSLTLADRLEWLEPSSAANEVAPEASQLHSMRRTASPTRTRGEGMTARSVTEASMDKIQVHKGYAAPAAQIKSSPSSLAINPAAVKTTSHYIGALRRRFWMVLLIAVPLAIASSILVLRLPPVYVAKGEIEINPPSIDPVLSALMTHEPGRHDPSATASYVPNHEAWLRSKGLATEGRERPEHGPCDGSIRRSGVRALQVAVRPANEKHQLVHRLPGRQRPGTDQETAGNASASVREGNARRERQEARRHRQSTPRTI